MPPYLIPAIFASLSLLIAAIAAAIALSERLDPVLKRRSLLFFLGFSVLWLSASTWFALESGFRPPDRGLLLPLAAAMPVILVALALWLSPATRRFADGLDQRWLIALQGLRVMGAVFVLLMFQSQLPWQFALPAGVGDVAVGVLAIVALRRVMADPASTELWAARVNRAGLLDFALAVSTGIMTVPGPAHLLALDAPNLLLNQFPLALIPAVGVPLFTIAHLLSIRLSLKRRHGVRAAETAAA